MKLTSFKLILFIYFNNKYLLSASLNGNDQCEYDTRNVFKINGPLSDQTHLTINDTHILMKSEQELFNLMCLEKLTSLNFEISSLENIDEFNFEFDDYNHVGYAYAKLQLKNNNFTTDFKFKENINYLTFKSLDSLTYIKDTRFYNLNQLHKIDFSENSIYTLLRMLQFMFLI